MSARLSSSLVLVIALSFMAVARAADTPQQALLAADAARVSALLAGNTSALAQVLADELTYIHTTGAVDSKAVLLGKLRSGELIFQSITAQGVTARAYGETGVVLGTAELHVLNAHQPRVLSLRFTATYVHRDGRWQLVAYQSTQLPAG